MGKRSRKQRQEARGSQSNCSVSDSSLLDRSSDTLVLKSAIKKQRTRQAVSTPLRHKDILSQFEFVPRSMSVADKMDSGGDTVDCSTDSARIISPDATASHASQQQVCQEQRGYQ